MVVAVTFTFLACNILPFILNAMDSVCLGTDQIPEYCGALYDFLIDVNNLLVEINSGVPFLIYILFSRCFRNRLCKVIENFTNRYYSLIASGPIVKHNPRRKSLLFMCNDKPTTFMLHDRV